MANATNLFGPADVLDLIRRQDGVYLPDVSARASVHTNGVAAVVELASQLDIDCEQPSERFRVTVERLPSLSTRNPNKEN